MNDFWDYVKGFFIISIMVGATYLGLAEGHEWWPFKPTETSPNAVYAYYDYDSEWDEGYDEGYSDGYDDGFDHIWIAVYEAEHYAGEQGGWHPEEAMMIIDCYENGEAFWENGAPPSKEEYKEAIQSLYSFYQYFYCGMYEELYD